MLKTEAVWVYRGLIVKSYIIKCDQTGHFYSKHCCMVPLKGKMLKNKEDDEESRLSNVFLFFAHTRKAAVDYSLNTCRNQV